MMNFKIAAIVLAICSVSRALNIPDQAPVEQIQASSANKNLHNEALKSDFQGGPPQLAFRLFDTTVVKKGANIENTEMNCLPLWNNTCKVNSECCSGLCHRGDVNWATGVCKESEEVNIDVPEDEEAQEEEYQVEEILIDEDKYEEPAESPAEYVLAGAGEPNNTGNNETSSPAIAEGLCSWYGAEGEIPEGWPTACGTGFSRYSLATAHPDIPKLPCGTRIRVTNLDNGRTVDVVADDRGPTGLQDRILDLTWAAFGEIEDHDKGLTKCTYTYI